MPIQKGDQGSERNWYKVATVALSVAMLVVLFISGVYYRWVDERRTRVQRVEEKIDEVLVRGELLAVIPTIKIELQTLEQAGLPREAFADLNEVPAIIRVRHVGGETARDITIEITSSCGFTDFRPSPSIETVTWRLDDNSDRLLIQIPQIRPNSVVEGVIKCRRIAQVHYEALIAQGRLSQGDTVVAPIARQNVYDFDDLDKIEVRDLSNSAETTATIERLRSLVRRERERSLIGGIPDLVQVFAIGFTPLVLVMAVFFGRHYLEGREANAQGTRIGRARTKNVIQPGLTKEQVQGHLGGPRQVQVTVGEGGVSSEVWEYEPKANLFFGWQPDAYIEFVDDVVTSVRYKEYGERDYR